MNDIVLLPKVCARQLLWIPSVFGSLCYLPRDRSSDVIFPCNRISSEVESDLVSQNLILLSKWPLIIVEPEPSDVTRSLQLDPANFVSIPFNKMNADILVLVKCYFSIFFSSLASAFSDILIRAAIKSVFHRLSITGMRYDRKLL